LVIAMDHPVANDRHQPALGALREERDRALGYLDAVNALILSLDRCGRVTLVNRFGRELLGYTEAELIGRDWFETCVPQPAGMEVVRPLFEQVMSGESVESAEFAYFENEVRCADGALRLIAWHNSVLRNDAGEIDGILCAANDITERRAMQAAQERAAAEAQRLADLKTAFLANMSHEIRTPLSALLGLAQIGIRDHGGESAGDLFGRIDQAGRYLLAVINDILDLSQIESGKLALAPEPFRLVDCVDETATLVLSQAREKGLTLAVDVGPELSEWVLGDALRLAQILINLLGNAVKFTEVGGVILRVTQGEAQGVPGADDLVLFEVEDTGIGIDDEQIATIFAPFEQADVSVTRRYGGSGLGLAISRNLARMMGGDLTVESRVGKGSRFSLRLSLPRAEPTHQPAAVGNAHRASVPAAEPAHRLAGLRILAVDDLEVNRMILFDLLTHEGAAVTLAADGRQALAAVADAMQPFDLVLMDIQMPGMDGYEASRRIRDICPHLPVIGQSAHALAQECDACLAAGMVAYLSKPLAVDALVRQLDDLLPMRPGPIRGEPTESATKARSGASPAIASASASGPATQSAPEVPPALAPESATRSADALVSEPVVDWDALYARFATSTGFVERLVRTVLDGEYGAADELRALAAAGDLDGYFRKAHGIKGLAGNLCANPLFSLAATACELGRAGDATVFDHVEVLAAGLESLLSELSLRLDAQHRG
jgi:PAS domain S-box-containing protein